MSACKLSMWMVAVWCAAVCGLAPAGPASASALPDGRVYEQVSSLANYSSDVYVPPSTAEFSSIQTNFPFQASANGNSVVFVGGPSVGGNEVVGSQFGNEYLGARLSGGGWTQSNISPANGPSARFQGFSADLSFAFLNANEPLSPTAPGFGEALESSEENYEVLYSAPTAVSGEYIPFFTIKPPYRSRQGFKTGAEESKVLLFAGASADSSHLLFMANDALTGASEGRPAAEGGPAAGFEKEDNLYESVDGQLRLVNVLPDNTTHANAAFGAFGPGSRRFTRVISADGSRIFWTDRSTGHIYVRENGATTVEISPVGTYQTATSDGSIALYTNGDLYKYEVGNGITTDLTPGTKVETVVGASDDGKYVYYVTAAGEFKLWHDGVTATIAGSPATLGEVTPDGRSVVFVTTSPESQGRINVYDADSGLVYCASCTAGGTKGILPRTNSGRLYRARWISADGSRVFFDSAEPLESQDANGQLDVYEWERPGADGCSKSEGCVYLLSAGSSTDASYFADASESGDDLFIITRAKLVGTDDNEMFDLYDLRVNGYVPVTPPVCTGTGCQGIPGTPPIFATPSSVTFEGVGNFAAPTKEAGTKPKPKPKKKPKHKKKPREKSKTKKSARKAGGHRRSGARGGRS